MQQYFYRERNEKRGPFSLEEMMRQPLAENTPVWRAGLGDWMPAADVPELANAMVLLRPARSNKKGWILGAALLAILAMGFGFRKQLFGKSEAPAARSLSSQQLYNRVSPSVLLIQHKYMYVLSSGDKRIYFNHFQVFDDGAYLSGLTEDSTAAVIKSESIQGTGFFISEDGKLLTNRHVAVGDPAKSEREAIGTALIESVRNNRDVAREMDSLKARKDSIMIDLDAALADTAALARAVALREQLSKIEMAIEESDEIGEPVLSIDSATLTHIAYGDFQVHKITLDLRVFTPGSTIADGAGIDCRIIGSSDKEEVDLALMQTKNAALPDTGIQHVSLARLDAIAKGSSPLQMNERLLLIGYNRGSDLGVTSEGIRPQLTEGRVSQNADAYKVMYTIPTLPGSSGSPVCDEKGRLVSVNFAGVASTQSFNYGIQPREVAAFLRKNGIDL